MFKQGDDESLYTAWERYKMLLKRCPMHDIDLKTQMNIVYHSLNDTSKGIIDVACCGAFKRRSAEEAKQLIEDLAKCNMKGPSDAIMHKLGNQEKRMHSAHEIGAMERDGIKRSAEGPIDEDPYQVEEANYLNEQRNNHFKPNPNLPTHYTPALRGHENFS